MPFNSSLVSLLEVAKATWLRAFLNSSIEIIIGFFFSIFGIRG